MMGSVFDDFPCDEIFKSRVILGYLGKNAMQYRFSFVKALVF